MQKQKFEKYCIYEALDEPEDDVLWEDEMRTVKRIKRVVKRARVRLPVKVTRFKL